jgi:hypothetical protein
LDIVDKDTVKIAVFILNWFMFWLEGID